ncbi:MAG TPA: type II toxin-antitoxin system VapC family toxin [Candidatus Sabulitectum sp.]|mgnify:CR=1 FL=1|nr:type II toxin-antitoxin system VapC family toxin [Candidatus Sabulitectum sp.]HPJ28799.1 type II toxin-antitoxin system VapC family toxin [Candidatus Sabulitectum sp.]HPR23080.1 type II toxin-antitoxin system VapC family toxin [Candidatus Sabulitectum sp.]
MPAQIVMDTDILVDYLRGYPPAVEYIRRNADSISIPAMVTAELYAGARDEEELETLDRFLGLFTLIPITAGIARAGGLYAKRYGKSHGIGLADAVIAAAAESRGAALKTLNVKHYPMFGNLTPPYRK